MEHFRSLTCSRGAVRRWFGVFLLGSLCVQPVCIPAVPNSQIECITPDGRTSTVSSSSIRILGAPALITDAETVSCALQEGETTFIISLPNSAFLDCFTFINQNAAACGEFKIAVSNSCLPADSPKWTQVDGIVPFAHKRLFNLSMLGIDAKYVKLSFRVEKAGRMTRLGLYRDQREQTGIIAKVTKQSAPAE